MLGVATSSGHEMFTHCPSELSCNIWTYRARCIKSKKQYSNIEKKAILFSCATYATLGETLLVSYPNGRS